MTTKRRPVWQINCNKKHAVSTTCRVKGRKQCACLAEPMPTFPQLVGRGVYQCADEKRLNAGTNPGELVVRRTAASFRASSTIKGRVVSGRITPVSVHPTSNRTRRLFGRSVDGSYYFLGQPVFVLPECLSDWGTCESGTCGNVTVQAEC